MIGSDRGRPLKNADMCCADGTQYHCNLLSGRTNILDRRKSQNNISQAKDKAGSSQFDARARSTGDTLGTKRLKPGMLGSRPESTSLSIVIRTCHEADMPARVISNTALSTLRSASICLMAVASLCTKVALSTAESPHMSGYEGRRSCDGNNDNSHRRLPKINHPSYNHR